MSLTLLLLTGCGTLVIDLKDGDDSGAGDADTDVDADTDADVTRDGSWRPDESVVVAEGDRSNEVLEGLWAYDATGDGNVDLVTARWMVPEARAVFSEVWAGDGAGGFAAPTRQQGQFSLSGGAPVGLGDVDGDGAPDMVIGTDEGFAVFPSEAAGFGPVVEHDIGLRGYHAGVADLDGDGIGEVFTGGYGFRVYRYNGGEPSLLADLSYVDQIWTGVQVIPAYLGGMWGHAAIWADRSRSDASDYVFALSQTDGVDYVTPWTSHIRFSDDGIRGGVAFDLTGDGLDEVVSTGADGLQVYDVTAAEVEPLWLNDGTTKVAASVAAGDLNGDGLADVLEHSSVDLDNVGSATSRLTVALNTGSSLAAPVVYDSPLQMSYAYVQNAAIADFNRDGCGDVAIVYEGASLAVFPGICSE